MISSLHASNRNPTKRQSSSSSLSSLTSCFSVEPQFRDEFEVRNIAQFFRKYPFSKYFNDLNEEQILSVSKAIRLMSMRPLQLLIPKGGTFSRFYVVMEGYLNVNYGGMLDGQFMHLLLGETIGSQNLIFDQQVDYTVHSGKEGCLICYLERDDFMRILKLHESFRVQKLISVLRGAQLLKSTSEEQIFKLFYACNLLEIEPNKLLYSSGHKTNGFFIVLEGQLSIDRRNNNSNKSEDSTKNKETESIRDNNSNKADNEQSSHIKGKCLFVEQGDYFGHLELLEREDKRRETVVNLQEKAKLLYLNNSLFNLFFNSSTQLANILENEQANHDQGGAFMCRSISPRKKQIRLSIQLNDDNNTSKTTKSSTTLEHPSHRSKYDDKKSQLLKVSRGKDTIVSLPISVLRLQAKLDSTRNNSRLIKNSDEKDQNQVIATQDAFTSPIDKDENFKGYLDSIETKRRVFTSEWQAPSQKHFTESNILSQITGKIDTFEELKGKLLSQYQQNKNKTCTFRSRSLGKRAELEVIYPPVTLAKIAETPPEKGGFESVHQKRYLTEQFQKYEKSLSIMQKTSKFDGQGGKGIQKLLGQFEDEDQGKRLENDQEIIENHQWMKTLPETDDLQNMLGKILQKNTPLANRQSPSSHIIFPANRNYFSAKQQQQKKQQQFAVQSALSSPLASAIGSPTSGRSKTIEGISTSYSTAMPSRKKKIVSTTYKIISSTHTLNNNLTGNVSELSQFSVGLASPRSVVKVPCQLNTQRSNTKVTDSSTDHHNSSDNLKPLLKEQISSRQILEKRSQNSLNQVVLSDKEDLTQNNNNALNNSKQNTITSPSQVTHPAQPLWVNPRSLLHSHSHNELILRLTQQTKAQSDQPEQTKNQDYLNIQELITPLESQKQNNQPQQVQFISNSALNTKHHHSHASLSMHQFQLPFPMKEAFKNEKNSQKQQFSEEQVSPLAQTATQEHSKLLLTMKQSNQNAMFQTKNLKDVVLKQTMSEFVKSQIASIQANQTSVILQKMMTSYSSRSKQHTQTNASKVLISSIGDPSMKCETTPRLRNNPPKLFKLL